MLHSSISIGWTPFLTISFFLNPHDDLALDARKNLVILGNLK